MGLQQRVERLIRRGRPKDPVEHFHEISFVLAKELGWTYEDIINAPLPFVFGVLEQLKKYYKEQEKAAKKRR